MKRLFLFLCILALTQVVSAVMTTEVITSTSQWVVPDGIYYVNLQLVGGGGSGNGGGVVYTKYCGNSTPKYFLTYNIGGGLEGTITMQNNVPVTPGQVLDITIGAGGSPFAGISYPLPTTPGSDVTLPLPTAGRGGTTSVVVNGTTTYSASGGYAGNITVSSPGCDNPPVLQSSNNYNPVGRDGLNPILQYSGNGQNSANFSMPYYLGSQGGLGFGAGGGAGGEGSPGSSPQAGGAGGHGATGVVYISYNTDQYYSSVQYNTPHNVKFIVKSAWGNPISGVTVNATYEESSAPWDWVLAWIGILRNPRVDTQNITMSGHTGDDGSIDFLMVESIQYNITAQKTGVIDQRMLIYPKDDSYTIWASGGGVNKSILYADNCTNPLDLVKVSISAPQVNSTFGYINVSYFDKMNATTSSTIYINQSSTSGNVTTETTVFSDTRTSQNFTASFNMTNPADQSYLIRINATTVNCGIIRRDYGVTFPPAPIDFGIPIVLLPYVAIGLMIFVGLSFTRTLPGESVVGICAIGWITFLMHWWDQAVDPVVFGSALVGFSFLAILYNVAIRSKKLPTQ